MGRDEGIHPTDAYEIPFELVMLTIVARFLATARLVSSRRPCEKAVTNFMITRREPIASFVDYMQARRHNSQSVGTRTGSRATIARISPSRRDFATTEEFIRSRGSPVLRRISVGVALILRTLLFPA